MHAFRNCLLVALGVGLLMLSACNFPSPDSPPQSGQDLVLTYAAQTVEAQLTLVAGGIQATITPGAPGETPGPPGEATPAPPPEQPGDTPTPVDATGTPDGELCDRGAFVADVNYPDNSRVEPGAEFTKTWRLRNTGTCTWSPEYAIVFERGDALDAPPSAPLTTTNVPPNETVEVSIQLKAPQTTGTYQGYWMLRNAAGNQFGLGEKADKNFWVKVNVGLASGISFDFPARSSAATWIGSGGGTDVNLTFGGADDDPNGVAKLKDGINLEDGSPAGVTLLTRPKHNDDGKITGTYPEYTIQEGDHFRAKLGFLENCGSGRVVFQLRYREGDIVQTLEEWRESCDGQLLFVDKDLSALKGKKVQFVLVVLADGSPVDDTAIWGSARIER